jgi:peroxiredoxin Q/BCP
MAKAPDFSLQDQNGKLVTLASLRGKKVLLYFYPKADTPGCTTQACGLRDNFGELKAAGLTIVGISPDEVKDLKKFEQKYTLPFTLLADPSTKTIQAYKAWGEKTFMGRRYMGVHRTSFLVDAQGNIVKTYENVKPETHVDQIIADVHGTKTSPTGQVVVRDLHEQNKQRAAAAKKKAPVKKTVAKPAAKAKAVVKKVIKKTATKAKTAVKKVVKKTVAKKPAAKTAKKK